MCFSTSVNFYTKAVILYNLCTELYLSQSTTVLTVAVFMGARRQVVSLNLSSLAHASGISEGRGHFRTILPELAHSQVH